MRASAPRRWLACAAVAVGTLGCSSAPPTPDWQMQAFSATERALHAQLLGDQRVEQAEWSRARAQLASTGQPQRVATLELLRCAAQMASLQTIACPAFDALVSDASPADRAYADYLSARHPLSPAAIALLPLVQQPIAQALASPTAPPTVAVITAIADPLSQLVAAAALWRAGVATPAVVEAAVNAASAQGWRVPLIAWLQVQRQQATAQGDHHQVQAITRRLQLLGTSSTLP